jgi:hypothetical protein
MLRKVSEFFTKPVGPGKLNMWNWWVIVAVIIIIVIIVVVATSVIKTTTTGPVLTGNNVRMYVYDSSNPDVKLYLNADSTLSLVEKSGDATKLQVLSNTVPSGSQIIGSWTSNYYITNGASKLTFSAGDGTCNISMSADTSDGNVLFFRTTDMVDPVPDGTMLNYNSPIGISPALTTVACYGQALAVNTTSGLFYSVNKAASTSSNMTWYFEPA